MSALLDGIRVIEFASHGVGPIAGLVLTQMGAEVIKIEHPAGGDPTRQGNVRAGTPVRTVPPGNHTIIFEFTNRNKKSVTVNLSKKEGLEVAYKLIEKADAFFSNYLPKSLNKLGFDYETLSKRNPKLVYAASSSYGSKGPDANKPAFDPFALVRSGLIAASTDPDTPPIEIKGTVADCLGGTFLAFAVISGLLARERLGRGQEIQSSLVGPLVWAQLWSVSQSLTGGELAQLRNIFSPLGNNYKCKDGQWIRVGTGMEEAGWPEFCHLFGLESLEQDPRFDSPLKRVNNSAVLIQIVADLLRSKTRNEWINYIKEFIPKYVLYEGIYNVSELGDDPQLLANNYIVEDNHATLGKIKMLRFPMNFSETNVAMNLKPAPQLGEHTEEILLQTGYSQNDVKEMRKNKII
jgi:crotonobetainyl-CoA:carnitine CoA-transferase CaiB-like acyl-CoA transferase